MTSLRGAILGCGMISEYHLRAWNRIPEVRIVAVADPNLDRARSRRSEFAPAATIHADLPDLLARHRPDFVDVLTPPYLHKEHCLLAARAGAHVICQKPLCESLADARSLIAGVAAAGRLLAVHENNRHRPWFSRITSLHRDGFFGPIRLLKIEQYSPYAPAEEFKRTSRLGILFDYGVHCVDIARALLGEPVRVHARLHRVRPDVAGESLAHLTLEYPDATATIGIAWKPGGLQQAGTLVCGDRAEASFEGTLNRGDHARFRILQGDSIITDESRNPTADFAESFYAFQRVFTDSLLANRPFEQTGEENFKTLAWAFAAYDSARTGQPAAPL